MVVSGLNLQPVGRQTVTLFYCLGEDAEHIISASSLSDTDKKNYAKVKALFQDHFIGKRNIIYDGAKFNLRNQREIDPFESYMNLQSIAIIVH